MMMMPQMLFYVLVENGPFLYIKNRRAAKNVQLGTNLEASRTVLAQELRKQGSTTKLNKL
jgi:hypothetical protein